MGEINLDNIAEERMDHDLFCYLMEASCTGKEIPLGETGYTATTEGRPLPDTCLVIVVEDTMFFAAGHVLNRGGMRIKRYRLREE